MRSRSSPDMAHLPQPASPRAAPCPPSQAAAPASWRRRDVLKLGVSALLLPACASEPAPEACEPSAGETAPPWQPARPSEPRPPWLDQAPDHAAAEALLPVIFKTPADALVAEIAQRRAKGLGYRDLVAAMLVASAVPSPLEVHKRANIFATHQLGQTLAPADDVALMFALHKLKDRVTWWLDPPAPALVDPPALSAAPTALRAALEQWDAAAAKTAVAVLCRAGQPEACRPPLLEYGARNHHWIGHVTIDVVQSLRALAFGGWFRAEQVLAVLVDRVCKPKGKSVEDFPRSRSLAAALVGAVRDDGARVSSDVDSDADAQVRALVTRWRSDDAEAAVSAAEAHLRGCGATSTLWQACRLASAEQTLRYPFEGWAKFAMHAVTTTNALRHAFDLTADPRLRLVLLLQAVAFVQRERAHCVVYGGDVAGTAWHIDALTPASPAPSSLDAVLLARKDGRPAAVAAALSWLQAGGTQRALVAHLRDHALPHALEEHQTKHTAAAFEEASLAGPWAATLAACAFTYGYEPTFPAWEAHAATVKALSAG